MGEYKDLVSLAPWDFIFQLGNLLILTLLVKKFLFKPVQKILNERQEKANALIADAQKAKQQAQTAQQEYEARLENAKEEAAQLLAQANQTAALRSEETLNVARAQAAQMKQKATAEIEQQRKKALNEVKDEIGGMAMAIASKVVEREINETDHQQLIDEFIEKVGDAS